MRKNRQWCYDHFINVRSMRLVEDVRDQASGCIRLSGGRHGCHVSNFLRCRQLKDICARMGIAPSTCNDDSVVYRK
jgi:hypothetical protein